MPEPSQNTQGDRVHDAPAQNWVDRYAPDYVQPYLRLARADRPIGSWLLLWPCWWSIALASGSFGGLLQNIDLLILFGVGSFVMRGAGCTYNDIVDRDFDAQVERTRSRPIPSGQVGVIQAWAFLIAQCLIGFLILISLSPLAIKLGFLSLGLIAIYPFMKRVTFWPQIWLGLTFNWGALMGWAAVTNSLSAAPIALYLGAIFWTIGYDTIYAHQDKEDDLMIGVKSSAIKLGENTASALGGFYGGAILLFLVAGFDASLGSLYYLGIALGAYHLMQQIQKVDIDNPGLCLDVFKSNRDFGAILMFAILAGISF